MPGRTPDLPSVNPDEYVGTLEAVLIITAPDPGISLGRLPIAVESKRCTVSASKPPAVVHDDSELRWELQSRDWCIQVLFSELDHDDHALDSHDNAVLLLDRAIAAWNAATAWTLARDDATAKTRLAPWVPRIGRIHVRAAAISDKRNHLALWVNPNKGGAIQAMALLPIANMFMTNGPAASPLPTITERLQEGLDLLNHGFVVEALLTTFATFEAHLRMALSDAIRRSRGEELEAERNVIKRIRQARFPSLIDTLPASEEVGWTTVRKWSPELHDEIVRSNKTRNQVLHHGHHPTRADVEWHIEHIWQATDWLTSQVSGRRRLDLLPAPNLASPQFSMWKPGDPPLGPQSPRASSSPP